MKKIILVTGGNRGIGLEICRQLAKQGNTVLMASRNLTKAEEIIKKMKGEIIPLKLDITQEEDIQEAFKFISDKFGKLDVLINNAGIMSTTTSASEANISEVKKVMDTNFFATWNLTVQLLPMIKKSSDGRIINMSSIMGALNELTGGHAGYRLSKTALNGLSIQLSKELSPEIKVYAVHPGWVKTEMGGPNAQLSVEQGADTAVWLATENNVPGGKFYANRKIMEW
jgi:NAD(P)-dependent dehydrogenase (short-subunit alcohol dehydrogenase family)